MRIIGLHNAEDSGVCLFEDGRLVYAASEERFSRRKLHLGVPALSLRDLLDRHGLALSDIDAFVYGWYGKQGDVLELARRVVARVAEGVAANPAAAPIFVRRFDVEIERDEATRSEFEAWIAGLGVPAAKVAYVDHHLSHGFAAFGASPFEEAYVFTMDGRGDFKSAGTYFASAANGLQDLGSLLSFDSLGFLYGQITGMLGFTPCRHEGKVLGLAAHGDPAATLPIFRRMVAWENDRITFRLGPYKPFYSTVDEEILGWFRPHRREDIAAGLQAITEELVLKHVAHAMAADGHRSGHVCLAGGIFANVRVNQKVAELPGVRSLFVFPHMGDGGLPVGSVLVRLHELTGQSKIAFPTAYLGPGYADDAVAAAVESFRSAGTIRAEAIDDTVGRAVQDLMDGKVVGWFEGRMEYGPRALGGRSILFQAQDKSANDWLNKRMNRTEFMPFAPVSPAETAADSYVGWAPDHRPAEFMTRTYQCTATFAERHPAVVHVDGSARPQVVWADRHRDYYRVVKTYCDRTGFSALINTSFNQHEEPIVCSPEDAIRSLVADTVDVLYLGRWRIQRQV